MMKIPPAKDFGGTTDIPKNITRDNWLQRMNNIDCVGCHQLGQEVDAHDPGAVRQVQLRRGGLDPPHRRPASPAR